MPTWSLCFRAGACWGVKGGRVGPSQPTRGAKLSYTKSLSSTSTPSFLSSTPHFLAHRPTLFSLGAARLPCSRHKQIPKVSSTNPSLSDSDRVGWYLIPLVFWRRSKLEQGYQRGAKNRAVAHRQTSTARRESVVLLGQELHFPFGVELRVMKGQRCSDTTNLTSGGAKRAMGHGWVSSWKMPVASISRTTYAKLGPSCNTSPAGPIKPAKAAFTSPICQSNCQMKTPSKILVATSQKEKDS